MTKKHSVYDFDSDDFAYLYFSTLRDFAESLGFKIPKNINPSWLVHNFQKKYKSHLKDIYEKKLDTVPQSPSETTNDELVLGTLNNSYYWKNPSEIGKRLYTLDVINFDIIEPEVGDIFTNHSNLIKSLKTIFRLPKGISLSITEPKPYLLKFDFKRDISEITKLPDLPPDFITFDANRYVKEFLKMFEEYTGFVNTKITKGGYEYDYNVEEVGFKDLLSLFLKKLKSEIKTSEFVDFIKGIKISDNYHRPYLTGLDFLIKNAGDISWYNTRHRTTFRESWQKFKNEFVPKVAKEMGHPSLIDFIGVDSPTARRV